MTPKSGTGLAVEAVISKLLVLVTPVGATRMVPSLQTFFGLTMPVSGAPIPSPVARALVKRIKNATALLQQDEVPVAQAAEFRRDAERYLALRRARSLRLPAGLERACDDDAHALMRLTANTPPMLRASERLVA